ncbi:hypothetical protein [Frankia canadensis]|uniref:hypothetical protein n=1 Tax=Frankia canadensis TaxID=1836972 RepID=UPI001FAF09D9|nr:hypothetical protein [Frankia canadensis]
MPEEASSLRSVIGQGVRRVRESSGDIRQEDVAMAARRHGLAWSRSRVGQLERGLKALPVDEVALLPSIMTEACGRPVSLHDLIAADARIALSPLIEVEGKTITSAFGGTAPRYPLTMQTAPATDRQVGERDGPFVVTGVPDPYVKIGPHWMTGWNVDVALQDAGEAEANIARKLGVPLVHVAVAAHTLWGRSLSRERDRLVSTTPDVSPSRRAAVRGRVTRQLTAKITEEIGSWAEGAERPADVEPAPASTSADAGPSDLDGVGVEAGSAASGQDPDEHPHADEEGMPG